MFLCGGSATLAPVGWGERCAVALRLHAVGRHFFFGASVFSVGYEGRSCTSSISRKGGSTPFSTGYSTFPHFTAFLKRFPLRRRRMGTKLAKMDFVVETRALRKEYDATVAVKDVDLRIPRGAIFALVGPNGAGKTTLLRMLAGLVEPSQGEAIVDGCSTRERSRRLHERVGYLPDLFGLYEDLTVEDYLTYFYMAYRVRRENRDLAGLLDRVGLRPKADVRVETLSRGMRQRLGVARALVQDPPLLLLDEPASGVDPDARQDLHRLFQTLAAESKTLVVSSHILTELDDYCTHAAVLREGVLIAAGALDDIHRALGGGRIVRLRTALASGAPPGALVNAPSVSEIRVDRGDWLFSFSGDDAALASLLGRLVSAGVPVTYFGEERNTLQGTYLTLTRRPSDA